MVLDVTNQFAHDIGKQVENKDNNVLEKLQVWHFNKLIHALNMKVIPLANEEKYMLIKLPNDQVLQSALPIFYELQLLGYTPIIASVEENIYLKRNPKLLREYIRRGVLLQANAENIIGENAKSTQKYALKLCKRNLVHMVYSDVDYFNDKPFILKNTYKYLEKKVSTEYVQYLKENIQNVNQGIDFHHSEIRRHSKSMH